MNTPSRDHSQATSIHKTAIHKTAGAPVRSVIGRARTILLGSSCVAALTLTLIACAPRSTETLAATPTASEGALRPAASLRASGERHTIDLVAQESTVRLAGHEAQVMTYNGSFPGPLLELRSGEQVTIRLRNTLSEPTSLHLHGLHVDPSVDDPFKTVPPGETAEYTFRVPADQEGTFWYHTHVHGRAAEQLYAGLAGAIVIRGEVDRTPELRAAEEHTLVLKDIALQAGKPGASGEMLVMNGREGNLTLVNGQWQPQLNAKTGTVRLRLVNAGNARYYRLNAGRPLQLIATDGGYLERPRTVDEVLLAPGERAEVLVNVNDAGTLDLRSLPYARGVHGEGATEQTEAVTLLTLAGSGATAALPETLGKVEKLDLAAATTRRIVFEERMDPTAFFINGRSYEPGRVDFQAHEGSVEVWEIENRTEMDHPFHLHTFSFQVLDRDGEPESYRAWRDVVNVRAGETVRIAVPLRGFTGKILFHCHIAEHEQAGMMAVMEVVPRGAQLAEALAPVEVAAPAAQDDHGGGDSGGHGGGHGGH